MARKGKEKSRRFCLSVGFSASNGFSVNSSIHGSFSTAHLSMCIHFSVSHFVAENWETPIEISRLYELVKNATIV
jgi:hypothetical protein